MSRPLVFVLKNNIATQFMQSCDVFEPFKFVGKLLETVQNDSHCHLTANEILQRAIKRDSNEFSTVGIIIPGDSAAFLPDYKVYSDGNKWTTVDDLCQSYKTRKD